MILIEQKNKVIDIKFRSKTDMTKTYKKGDKVSWESSEGEIFGKVEKKLTSPIEIKGHHVAASEENPQYLVTSDKTGQQAAHKPEALKKVEK